MKKKLACCLLLSISMSAFAEKPASCPTVDAIKAAGVNVPMKMGTEWYVMNFRNKFDTPVNWAFGVIIKDASDADDALKKSNERLGLLRFVKGPFRDSHSDGWQCYYNNKQLETFGFAVTPPPELSALTHFAS